MQYLNKIADQLKHTLVVCLLFGCTLHMGCVVLQAYICIRIHVKAHTSSPCIHNTLLCTFAVIVVVLKPHHDTFYLCSDARSAEVSHLIKWHSGPCSQWVPRDTPSTVVVNPPWGLRLLNDAENAESDQDTRGILHAPGVERCCPQLFSLLMLTVLQTRLSLHCILTVLHHVWGKQG